MTIRDGERKRITREAVEAGHKGGRRLLTSLDITKFTFLYHVGMSIGQFNLKLPIMGKTGIF